MPTIGVASVNGQTGNAVLNAEHISDPNTGLSVSERLSEIEITRLLANRLYPGRDLTILFADEINTFGGNPWAWIRSRIHTGNYRGINIGDFISFTAGGSNITAEIAGINTYTGYGDTVAGSSSPVGNHIDFISRNCWPTAIRWNLANYNNGLSSMPNPWLVSNLFAWLNSLQMHIPNDIAADPETTAVDYTTSGIYNQLPEALKDVIVQKRLLLPRRYVARNLLIDDNNWDWRDIGFLWIPGEIEVFGINMWGSVVPSLPGRSVGGFRQYPLFEQAGKRTKGVNIGGRLNWWLLNARGGSSTSVSNVSSNGIPNETAASSAIHTPVCFRIA